MTTQGFDQAFEKVGQLARDFQANADFYLSKSYQEAQVRKDFIDKFFIALGWDVNHETQSNPFEQEVKVEPPVATGGTQRRADYAFHVAPNFRDMRFLVEAKKPSRDLATPDNYFQTIRYGWNKQNPLASLTDFEHLHILDRRIDEERVSRVFDKLKRRAKPLGEIVQNNIFLGVKTGLNEAFEIDAATRRRFVRECRTCEPLIRPFLSGQDIRRYFVRETGLYLIAIPSGWTQREMSHLRKKVERPSERDAWNWFAKHFEPLAEHLLPFAEPAKKRQDQGDYWWELRPCDYYEVLNQRKIIYPDIAKHPRFFLDTQGTYIRNTAYCLGNADPYLLGLLNSRLAWFAMSQISIPFGTRAGEYRYRLFTQYVEQIPIRAIDVSDPADKSRRDHIVRLVEQMLDAQQRLETARSDKDKNYYSAKCAAFDRQLDGLVYELYGLTEEEIQIVESSVREFSGSEL